MPLLPLEATVTPPPPTTPHPDPTGSSRPLALLSYPATFSSPRRSLRRRCSEAFKCSLLQREISPMLKSGQIERFWVRVCPHGTVDGGETIHSSCFWLWAGVNAALARSGGTWSPQPVAVRLRREACQDRPLGPICPECA